jgi:hypothetical protein
MNAGRYVISQLLDLVHRETLSRIAERYEAEKRAGHFGCRQQFACMVFAQLTWREGLRDIVDCLNARPQTLYHLGFREPLARSTLADANERRDWRMWQDLGHMLIRKARPLYAGEDLGIDLDNTVYALDSTTIELSLTLFPWADFRKTKSAIKMHTQTDLRGSIPTCALIGLARPHDVLWPDELLFEPGAFYIMDRGYMDFLRLYRIVQAGAFFVTRAKDNLRFSRLYSRWVEPGSGVCSDQVGRPALPKARIDFPVPLRRIRYFDKENNRHLIFLTNNLAVPALVVATLYRLRWRIELFFRWIKQHLRIKHYYGNTPNAVKTQIWIALSVYLIIAILHKQLNLPGTLYRTIQVLSVHPFEKTPVDQLLMEHLYRDLDDCTTNQLSLWNL